MPPIPAQCIKLKKTVDDIELQIGDLQDMGHFGAGKITQLTHELIDAQKKLDLCIIDNAPGWATSLDLTDLDPGPLNTRIARLWAVSSSEQSMIEERPVKQDRVGFIHGPSGAGDSIGISISEAPTGFMIGPLFRSGSLSALPVGAPTNPAGVITIIVAPPSTLNAKKINGLLTGALPGLPAGTVINQQTAVLEAGIISVTVVGSTPVPFFVGTIGFKYTLKVTVQPSWDMNNVSRVCAVSATGVLTITTPVPFPFSFLADKAAAVLEPDIRVGVVAGIENAINLQARAQAEATLVRPLAPSERLSVRGVVITPDPGGAVTFFPTIGAFGPIALV